MEFFRDMLTLTYVICNILINQDTRFTNILTNINMTRNKSINGLRFYNRKKMEGEETQYNNTQLLCGLCVCVCVCARARGCMRTCVYARRHSIRNTKNYLINAVQDVKQHTKGLFVLCPKVHYSILAYSS